MMLCGLSQNQHCLSSLDLIYRRSDNIYTETITGDTQMKIHFKTRTQAREFARGNKSAIVRDIREQPFNGMFGWAVVIDTSR